MKEDNTREIKETTQDYNENCITEEELKAGAFEFERFWLRPIGRAGKVIPVRLRINKRFDGWRLKDELVTAIGLKVGDTISTEVSILFTGGLIDYSDDMDLFADGEAADWLLDCVIKDHSPIGCVLDCFVKLSYCEAPVGKDGKKVNKASLILSKGIQFITFEEIENETSKSELFERILSDIIS